MINLDEWLGTYQPVTYEVIASDGATYEVVADGMAGVDWTYIARLGVLLVTVSIIFTLLVSLVRRVGR